MLGMKKIAFGALISVLAQTALAVPINGLVNTGAGVAAGSQDLNYSLTITGATTSLLGSGEVFGYAAANPHPWWLAPEASAASQWLTPFSNAQLTLDPANPAGNGIYTWTLEFDLDYPDFSSANLIGRWASDNNGAVFLNGHLLGTTPIDSFAYWTTFSASTSQFVAGRNVLQFVITNLAQDEGNPTGLRVEFTSSNVPEPESYALLLGGLGLLGVISRRKTK
jgi:hypothetical protein